MNNDPLIRDFVTLNKSVINYLPRCSYHLLYFNKIIRPEATTAKSGAQSSTVPFNYDRIVSAVNNILLPFNITFFSLELEPTE